MSDDVGQMSDEEILARGGFTAQPAQAAAVSAGEDQTDAKFKMAGQMLSAGYSEDDVKKTLFDVENPDDSGIRKMIDQNMKDTGKPLSFLQSMQAGYQGSATGLLLRGKAPEKKMTGEEPWYDRAAAGVVGTAADIPEMIGGFLAGAPEGGPLAPITGMAGAFALPASMRATLMDAYSKGGFKNIDDFAERTQAIASETGKAYAVGAMTAGAGMAADAALTAGGAGVITTEAGKTAAEIGTMTTAQHDLNLKEISSWRDLVPSAQDFLDSAIVMFGMKGAMEGAGYLRDLYAKTGVTPDQAVDAGKADPSVATTIGSLTGKGPIMQEAAPAAEVAAPAAGTPPEAPPVKSAQDQILEKINIGGADAEKEPMTFNKFVAAAVDKLEPIRQMEEGMKANDTDSVINSSYKTLRLLPAAGDKAEHFLKYGTLDFKTNEINGKSLDEVLTPVKDDLNGIRAYWASKHALDIESKGLQSGMPLEAAKEVVDKGADKYQPVVDELVAFSNRNIDYLRDSGVLSSEAAKTIKERWPSYAPFNRFFGDDSGQDAFGFGSKIRNPIKRLTGSERDIIDPVESLIRNTFTQTQIANRNAAVKSFFDNASKEEDPSLYFEKVKATIRPTKVSSDEMNNFLKENGIDDIPDESLTVFRAMHTPLGKDEVGYFDKGDWQVMKVDPDLAEAFNGTPRQLHGMLFELLRAPALMLRSGFTTPEFIVRHFIRNQLSVGILSPDLPEGAKAEPGPSLGDFLYGESSGGEAPYFFKGLISYLGKDDDYKAWLRAGGRVVSPSGVDRSQVQDVIGQLTDRSKWSTPLDLIKNQDDFVKPWNVVRSPFDFLHLLQSTLEGATRLGGFKKAMQGLDYTKENIANAAYYDRNMAPDPSRMGNATATWNALIPLFNIEIQHTSQLAAALTERPIPTLAKAFAAITVPAALLWAANHDSDEWKEAHQWERDYFQLLPMGSITARVPRPFLMGEIFGAIPERILDKISGADTDNRGLAFLANDLKNWAVPNVMPAFLAPALEQMTNYNFFKGSPLIPDHIMQEMPEYRYTEYTSELTKSLGRIVGKVPYIQDTNFASPIVIDNYVAKWTGGLGVYALQAADKALREEGVLPDPALPSSTLADMPFIKGFVVRYPSATADSIQRFQEDYRKQAQVFNTFTALNKMGETDEAAKLVEANQQGMIRLQSFNESLNQQNALVRLLYKNPSIDPDEKRQLIDSIYMHMIDIAREGNAQMKQINQAVAK